MNLQQRTITAGRIAITALASFVGLLIGAGLLTIQWEGYQRDGDLKGKLVSQVSSSATRAAMAARFVATGAYAVEQPDVSRRRGYSQQKYNEGKRKWEEDLVLVGAQLRAYYDDPSLAKDWEAYANAMSTLYQLSYPIPPGDEAYRARSLETRRRWADTVKDYVGTTKPQSYWDYIVSREDAKDQYSNSYIDLSVLMLKKQERINKQILESPTIYSPMYARVWSGVRDLLARINPVD
jgi:hypothetical protein